jgi:hypothetical protein
MYHGFGFPQEMMRLYRTGNDTLSRGKNTYIICVSVLCLCLEFGYRKTWQTGHPIMCFAVCL